MRADGLALATLFSALGWLVAHHIASPLRAIARAARAISVGVPGATIPAVGGAKEIDTLSRSLRELVSSLRASNRALVASNAALERMESIAYQDRLTALPNRRFFEQYLDIAQLRARQGHDRMVILYLDLDGFKPVNDQMGHEAGDEVLRQVGLRLASSLRQEDVVARIGGDEFACILVVSETEAHLPREVAWRLIAAVNAPMAMGGQTMQVGCTSGLPAGRRMRRIRVMCCGWPMPPFIPPSARERTASLSMGRQGISEIRTFDRCHGRRGYPRGGTICGHGNGYWRPVIEGL